MQIPIDSFERYVNSTIIKRATSYYENGNVIDVAETRPGEFEATVEGSEDYTVQLKLEDGKITEYDCDCPYDMGPVCKHIVAVIMHLQENGFDADTDIDNDGVLELLVARGESKEQPLTLYKAIVNKENEYLRIKPLNKYGAPARGATVTLITNKRKHSKTIDAGSGYLCQMEPVAHYGIRKKEKNFNVEVRWTDGSKEMIDIKRLNQTITVKQK